jgi:hypothetical protein
MSARNVLRRSMPAALAAALLLQAGSAAAIEFQMGESTLKIDNLLTIGASWRMQDRDPDLIGKSTLYRMQNGPGTGLCFIRTGDDGVSGADPALDDGQRQDAYDPGVIGSACTFSNNTTARDYANAPGSFAPNGDNGNLNFDKHDLVHAVAKLTTDISLNVGDYNFFVRPIWYFDANYTSFEETHPDTTFYPLNTQLPRDVEDRVGSDLELLDYHVSTSFDVLDRSVSVKVGNQVLNWGESSLLLFNSLNTVNALDATKIRFPGSDLKEFFQPQGMVVIGTDLVESISVEGWYAYEWKPVRVDPVGTYFSQSDTLGAGGTHAMLGFAKNPDDPLGIYEPIDTCTGAGPTACFDSSGLLGSVASRTIYRDFAEEKRREPEDGGYGVALKTFLEDFNNGTEVAFYYASYPSRFPIASLFAADATCIGQDNPGNPVLDLTPLGACNETLADGMPAGVEPVPVDTARLVVEYPEDINLYGVSFNTTIGDFALSGEYAFRDNLPVQIHTTDLTLAALNPAVPQDAVDLAPIPLRIPGRREAFPDFVSVYRGVTTATNAGYGANEYIAGYERLKVGQANLTVLKLIGGDNPLGASQMTMLFEMGMNQVFDMPGLDELQFQGGGVDTHISDGSNFDPANPGASEGINPDDPYLNQNTPLPEYRQNPAPHKDLDGFGSDESYGYRVLNLNRWDSALFGANIETLTIIQHDVKGTTPGIGTNFIEGRKQYAFGLRFDYLSTWIGEVRYSWNTGGAKRDSLRDRDNIAVSLGVQF